MTKEEKRKAYHKRWCEANKESIKERKKEYYEANKQVIRELYKRWCEANKDRVKELNKRRREENKEENKAYMKDYYELNKEKLAAQKKVWSANNKDKVKGYRDARKPKKNEYHRNRRKTDDLYALSSRLRNRTSKAFRLGGYSKNTKTQEMLGCDWATLKIHIEKQFTKTMSWSKPETFHIDHIKPLANAKTKEELIELCHYTNLQPLSPEINLMKSNLTPSEWELKKQTKEYQQLIITQ